MIEPERRAEFRALVKRLRLRDAGGEPFADPWSFVDVGWQPLVEELVRDLDALGWDRRVLQMKEKFGSLRFYVADQRPELLDRTMRAREESETVCERCGKRASLRVLGSGRHVTRCDGCLRLP